MCMGMRTCMCICVFGSVVEAGGLLPHTIAVDSRPVLNYTTILAAQGVRPIYAWSYTPTPLQRKYNDWTSGPNNLTLWQEMHKVQAKAGSFLTLNTYCAKQYIVRATILA